MGNHHAYMEVAKKLKLHKEAKIAKKKLRKELKDYDKGRKIPKKIPEIFLKIFLALIYSSQKDRFEKLNEHKQILDRKYEMLTVNKEKTIQHKNYQNYISDDEHYSSDDESLNNHDANMLLFLSSSI